MMRGEKQKSETDVSEKTVFRFLCFLQ